MSTLTVVDHPIIRDALRVMRSEETEHGTFRRMLDWVSPYLCYEALRDLPEQEVEIRTPLEPMTAHRPARSVVGIPILRAGLGMVEGLIRVIPDAFIGHLGMYRDAQTHEPIPYYSRLPDDLGAARVLVLDPMLATGGSAAGAIDTLKASGAADLMLVCLVAAPEGVERLREDHPDVRVVTAALDRELDGNAYIRPGLGDAGDRIYGTTHNTEPTI